MHGDLEQTSAAPRGGFMAAPEASSFNAAHFEQPLAGGEERKVKVSWNRFHNSEFQTNGDEDINAAEHPLGSRCKTPRCIHLECQDVQEIFRCLSGSPFVCK